MNPIRAAIIRRQWEEASTRATFLLAKCVQLAAEFRFVEWVEAYREAAELMERAKELRAQLQSTP